MFAIKTGLIFDIKFVLVFMCEYLLLLVVHENPLRNLSIKGTEYKSQYFYSLLNISYFDVMLFYYKARCKYFIVIAYFDEGALAKILNKE